MGATLGLAILATACTSAGEPRPQQASLVPGGLSSAGAALPAYRAGQKFTFSDRRTRRVVAVEGGAVRWSSKRDKDSYLVAPNFVVPVLRRENSSSVVSHRVFGSPDDLWPLRVGKSVRFRVARKTVWKEDGRLKNTSYTWRCDVSGRPRLTVPAGTFDTYRIDCQRQSGPRKRPDRRITWYYAPEIGHYARREKEHLSSGTTRVIELVSGPGGTGAMARATAPAKPREAAKIAPKPAAARYAVHLASYRDAATAEHGWSEFRARFPELLSGKQSALERADLGERGVFQRLLVVPFASWAEAKDLCARINAMAAKQYCLVTMG